MNAPLLNEASLMAVVAGEFVCVGLQVVHLFLVASRGRGVSGRLSCAHEAAALSHLGLALVLTVGARLIGAPVLARALEASRAFWLLWANAAFSAAAVFVAARLRRPAYLLDALFMGLCAPAPIRALGAAWNVAAVLDIAWFLFRGLSGIVDDLVRRSDELTELSLAEALMGMPAGILVVGATGGSTFMNMRMRECLFALGLPCDLGDQSGLWGRLRAVGRDLSAEASSLGAPDALGAGDERLLVELPDATTWLFARDARGAQGPGARVVCLDVTEAVRANAALGRTNRELEEAADELRSTLADVGRAAEAAAYLRMRSRVHDVVGQRLSILHRYLETGRTDAASVAELDGLLSSVMDDLRGDAADPRAELDAVVSAFALVGVDVEVRGELPAGEAGSAFAHIVREACTNACRHGHAKRVFVDLEINDGGRAVLTVVDDGEAGDGPTVERGGIAGMRRRVGMLGGTLSVERGARFTIRAEIPAEGGAR